MARKIRYGIIGFGLFAERAIAPAIQTSPNSELVAIQKRSQEAAKSKAALHSIPYAFATAKDLLGSDFVDAVYIASANALHCPETLLAARARKHILVEKPMAVNSAQCRRMISACKKAKVKLMVGHMLRFSPLVHRMRDMVRSGLLGDVRFARAEFIFDSRMSQRSWFFDRKLSGGGPSFDVGVHGLDTLQYVLDDTVISVKSDLRPRPSKTRTEESANVSLVFSKGTLASIYSSFVAPIRRTFIEFVGTEAILSARSFTQNNTTVTMTLSLPKDGGGEEVKAEQIEIPNLYVDQVTSFSNSILSNTEPMVGGVVGLENQRVLDAIMRSPK